MPSISTCISVTVFFGVVFALTRRPFMSFALTLYLLAVVLLCSWVKLTHLGLALTLADVYFFSLRPVENFKLFFQYPLLGITLLSMIALTAAGVWMGLRFERPIPKLTERPTGPRWRIGIGVLSIAVAVGASWIATPRAQARVDNGDSYVAFLVMYESQHPNGPIGLINLFFNNRSFEPTLPAPREQTRFALADSPANIAGGPDSVSAAVRPDIFLILEESTFDPTLIAKCPQTYCDNAILHPQRAATRTQQGPLLVHTTGGGTWLAEFAMMSGLDWRLFGRGGAFAPVSLAPRLHNALAQYLRSMGYRTIAVYPTAGNFLSARRAYEYYGFDEFYDANELHLPEEWGDTYDRMVFDKALKLTERDDPRPVFVFVLTIRNHGPHGPPKTQVPQAFKAAAKATNNEMGDYLARMRDSSVDFVALADRWLKSPRPRVLAWFGDHQPEAAWDFTEHIENLDPKKVARNVPQQQLTYVTQYQFSANFGGRSQSIAHDALDLSYLSAELVMFAGVPLSKGMTAAHSVAAECQGLMFDCTNRELIADYLDFRIYGTGSIQ